MIAAHVAWMMLAGPLPAAAALAPHPFDTAFAVAGLQTPARAGDWAAIGAGHLESDRLDEAAAAFERAAAEAERTGGDTLTLAGALRELAVVRLRQQRVEDGLALLRRALSLCETPALTGSRTHGLVLQTLGQGELTRENFADAQRHSQAAADMLSRLDPEDLEISRAFQTIGVARERTGDSAGAEAALRRALAIARARAPGTRWEARPLNDLGINAKNRGDLAAAERYYLEALPLHEHERAGSLEVAIVLGNLGVVADLRGDFDRAEAYQKRALAIREKHDPGGRSVFMSLNNLGIIAAKRKDAAAAERYFHSALAIVERLTPGSLSHADALGNLAIVLKDLPGRLSDARRLQEQALALREQHAPKSLRAALSVAALAEIVEAEGDLERAETLYRQAVVIRERMAPGSTDEAMALHALGRIARKRGDLAAARHWYTRAIAAFEGQSSRLGGAPEVQTGFRTGHRPLYRDLIDLLVTTGDREQAFNVYERSRARVLLELLAQRQAGVDADVPDALRDERRRVDAEFDRVQARLAGTRGDDAGAIDGLHARLRELRAAQVEVAGRIRQASPRAAAVRYPSTLDLGQAQAALDPGTLALAYGVLSERTVLFAVSRTELTMAVLPVGEPQLREEVDHWRRLAARGRTEPQRLVELTEGSAALFDRLIGPVAAEVDRHQRLLVIADGPLHLLPFGALVRRDRAAGDEGTPRYLIESTPVYSVVSFTVAAQTLAARASRPRTHARQLVAFGAPRYPTAASDGADAATRSFIERSASLAALPGARREATELAAFFGDAGEAFVGDAATEARARDVMPGARYVHLAVHGWLNETFPLNSALAFTIPEQPDPEKGNGLLQAWEVMDQLRLDTDLVVLSACDTGLGPASGGDGLLGLSRAFRFAGARSVVASLWPIADETTPAFMRRLYAALKRGVPTAEALAAAQRDTLKVPDTGHPYFWAPFVLSGDWR